jgi:hypothetical protein
VCEIVLFRVVIVLFVAVGVVLIVDTYYTSVVSAAPICISPGVGVWAPTKTSLTKIYFKKNQLSTNFVEKHQPSTLDKYHRWFLNV